MEGKYDYVKKISDTFSKACGLDCQAIDLSAAEDGFEKRMEIEFCSICSCEQVKRFKGLKCENLHIHAINQSEKWGGKYEYLCPAGLAFVCANIIKSGDAKYGITAGPFLMVAAEEFLSVDLERLFIGTRPKKLVEKAKQLPYFECGRVSSLAEMLYMLNSYAAERSSMELQILEQAAKSQSEVFYSIYGIKTSDALNYRYPIEAEKQLQLHISQGDKAASQRILNDILGHIFFCSGGSFEIIKARITELIVLLSRAAIEGGADVTEVFGLNYDYLNEIQSFITLDDLNQWLARVLIRFTNSVFDVSGAKHSEVIKEVAVYIRNNYMKKISLNDISEHVNFSVSYLSRIFKEEIGCNLSTYINNIRIDNSKILLLKKNIPLVDVAYLSGFDDQSYFSKVFKNTTGVTPGKFREKRGKI